MAQGTSRVFLPSTGLYAEGRLLGWRVEQWVCVAAVCPDGRVVGAREQRPQKRASARLTCLFECCDSQMCRGCAVTISHSWKYSENAR